MNNQISERRIRNNKKKRCRQLRRHLMITVITLFLTIGISSAFFSIGSRAQAAGDHNISYKYYKSVTVDSGIMPISMLTVSSMIPMMIILKR